MDLNRVILIGRLANEPEKKMTPSGIAVTSFRLAVNRPMSSEARQSGQEKQADFIPIVAWRQSAEYAANYLSKGRLIAVEGRLQIREYTTQDGQKRRDTEVVADNLKSLDRPKDPGEGGSDFAAVNRREEYSSSHDRFDDEPQAGSQENNRAVGQSARTDASRPGAKSGSPTTSEDDLDDPFADD